VLRGFEVRHQDARPARNKKARDAHAAAEAPQAHDHDALAAKFHRR
jgi:hypothetical protein